MDTQPKRVVDNDRFASYIGAELVEVEPGYALARLEVQDHHLNGADLVQGGVLFTLADFAFAAASNEAGRLTLGINTSMSFVKAAQGKVITAEAKKISATSRLCNYTVSVYDENKELAAQMMATGYIMKS